MIVLIPLPRSLMTENATCSFGIDMGGGNYAISSCDINIVFVEVIFQSILLVLKEIVLRLS